MAYIPNYNFAKPVLKPDGTPDYAPSVIRVPTHHHEEWDEPIYDPETGEPVIDPETGEPVTEHKSRDWTTYETKVSPSATDYHAANYVDVITRQPEEPAPEGSHYEASGWEVTDGAVRRTYEVVENPPPPPRRWSRLSLKTALAQAGMFTAAKEYLAGLEIEDGYTAWEQLTDCDYIEEGYPNAMRWNGMLDGMAVVLGKTREEIDAFLDGVPTEGGV